MLSRLRDPSGAPAFRVRVAAGLIVAGLVLGTAPVVVLPVVRAVIRLVQSL
jgi:hypothetical protein